MSDANAPKTPPEASGADPALNAPANIPAATEFLPSGAPAQTTDFDVNHPAVDNNPRANTTVVQNQIDFNDPTIEGHEAVARNLGYPTEADKKSSKAKA